MSTNSIATAQYKCQIMDGQTAMVNGAANFYNFGSKLHNVGFVLICVTGRLINHCLMGEMAYGIITPRNIKLSRSCVQKYSFISQSIFSL